MDGDGGGGGGLRPGMAVMNEDDGEESEQCDRVR